ncbi:hypothetical protein HDV01_006906 [Terramyces sp. JEL0728]|nr:hypothetical protein HDV01_006906 [Terramyces sp. JEL0728]
MSLISTLLVTLVYAQTTSNITCDASFLAPFTACVHNTVVNVKGNPLPTAQLDPIHACTGAITVSYCLCTYFKNIVLCTDPKFGDFTNLQEQFCGPSGDGRDATSSITTNGTIVTGSSGGITGSGGPAPVFDGTNSAIQSFSGEIKKQLEGNPIVILNNINLQEKDFLDLTAKLGIPINLPDLLVPAKIPNYPEFARVANFDQQKESIDLKYAFGNYWHHDGNFWLPGENRIFNLLHSKMVPNRGGNTGFINTRKAYEKLPGDVKQSLDGVKARVDLKNIEDFRNVPDSIVNQLGLPISVLHSVVQQGDGFKALYLPFYTGTVADVNGKEWKYEELFNFLFSDPELYYYHSWSENQIVVWDNTQCMHKAMGQIEGKRLLWRSQARVL